LLVFAVSLIGCNSVLDPWRRLRHRLSGDRTTRPKL